MKIIVADDEVISLERLVNSIREVQPDAEIFDYSEPEDLLLFAQDRKSVV